MASSWIAYNELAWTENLLADPADDEVEVAGYVVGKIWEIFRGNNFAYTGEQEDLHVTLLENNYINRCRPNTYEATLVYLIRRRG